jgi:tetratricopeptide (TPR) repeat protein
MQIPRISILAAWALAAVLADPAVAQRPQSRAGKSSQRARAMNRAPGFRATTDRRRGRLDTFDQSRLGGMRTRTDQIQNLLQLTQPGRHRRKAPADPVSAVELLLSQKNLLARRSPMARDQEGFYVSADAVEEMEEAPTISPLLEMRDPPPDDPFTPALVQNPYNMLLTDRLSQKADDYFEIGVACFRTGDFRRAGNYFELDKKVNRQSPRAYLATMLVAFEQRNMNQAGINLRLAFQKFETLEDMKLDIDSFYGDRRAFERTLGAARLVVTRAPDDGGANLFLGYLAWLDGDLSVARSSVEKAVRTMSDARTVPQVEEFSRLIGNSDAPAAKRD